MKGRRRWLGWFVVAGIGGVGVQARVEQTPSRPPLFVAISERGPAWDDTKTALAQPAIGDHMAFLQRNFDKLTGAAPFQQGLAAGGADRVVGMVIATAATQDDAERLVGSDPAVASGLMKATVRRWLAERLKSY